MSTTIEKNIIGVAVDAGSGLEAALRSARGSAANSDDPLVFKRAILEILGAGANTVLVDANLGPELLAYYPADCR